MTAYDDISPRARWFLENFDELGLAEMCADRERAGMVAVPGEAFDQLVKVATHVSLGRSAALTQGVYPDAVARRALGALDDAGLLRNGQQEEQGEQAGGAAEAGLLTAWADHADPHGVVLDLIARAIHRYDYHHALSGNDTPSVHHRGEAVAVLAALQGVYVPPPPGSDRDALPEHLRVLIAPHMRPYLSTACETAAACRLAAAEHPEYADELRAWEAREHAACRITRKQDMANCDCTCRTTAVGAETPRPISVPLLADTDPPINLGDHIAGYNDMLNEEG